MWLISDEVYHGLVYDGAPQTSCAWQTSRNAVVVNSFSKYYAMTGWRLGWMLVPTGLRRAVDRLTGNFTICPPVLSQIAGVAAFTPEATAEADGNLHHYATNRSLLLDGLRHIGIDRLAPTDGAFYVYADVSDLTNDSFEFCSKLLADTGVAIAPGIDFDTERGNSFVRLSFAGPTSDIEEALRRIGALASSPLIRSLSMRASSAPRSPTSATLIPNRSTEGVDDRGRVVQAEFLAAVGTVDGQVAAGQVQSRVVSNPGGRQAGYEVRRGVRRDEPAAHFQIDLRRGPRAEFVERLPLATDQRL